MSTNLVSYVMQYLTPDMVGRMAAALGLNRSDAQSGVSAAVPALLAAFTGLADKPGGAQSLVNTIKQQSGIADNFASMIGGSNQASFIDRGSSLLTSLLGSSDSSSLASAVGRFAGLGQGKATSLIGMLAPLVMGLIGKQIGTRGIDVGSLTSLLASQRDQIAQAMPGGMGQMLESTGLGGGFAAPPAAAPQVSRASDYRSTSDRDYARSSSDQYRTSSDQYRSSASSDRPYPTSTQRPPERSTVRAETGVPNWVYWLLPLLVLGGLLWYLLNRPHEEQHARVEQPSQPTEQRQIPSQPQTTGQAPSQSAGQTNTQQQPAGQTQMGQAPGSVVVGGVDVKNTLGDSLADMRTSLQSIVDGGSAQAALPKLEAAKNQIDRISSLSGQLSDDQRKTLAGVITGAMPVLSQLSDRVMAMPGVGDVLKPTIGPMKTKLAEMSGSSTTGSGR
jgi:hypothetical protein